MDKRDSSPQIWLAELLFIRVEGSGAALFQEYLSYLLNDWDRERYPAAILEDFFDVATKRGMPV
jgi:hypothetical protein